MSFTTSSQDFEIASGPGPSGDARIEWRVLPTGGIVVFKFLGALDESGPWTLTRTETTAAGGTVVYVALQGDPSKLFVDCGDGTDTFLDPTSTFVYKLATPSQTLTTDPISPTGGLMVEPDSLTLLLLRGFKAAFSTMVLPAGIPVPSVRYAMPLRDRPTLPLISFAQESMQDTHTPSGQNVSGYDNQAIEPIYELVNRRYRVTAMANTPTERGYFRDAIIGVFKSVLGPLLTAMGQNVTHGFHAADSQVTAPEQAPGFYFSDVALQFSGTFSVHVTMKPPGTFQVIDTLGNP